MFPHPAPVKEAPAEARAARTNPRAGRREGVSHRRPADNFPQDYDNPEKHEDSGRLRDARDGEHHCT